MTIVGDGGEMVDVLGMLDVAGLGTLDVAYIVDGGVGDCAG